MDARIAWPMRWGGVTAIIRAETCYKKSIG